MSPALRRLHGRRGSAILLCVLAMLALIAATTTAFLAVAVAHVREVRHQRDGVQALYMAESGVEELLDQVATTGATARIQQEITGPTLPAQPSLEQPAPAARPALPLGRYRASCRREGETLVITSVGQAPTAVGPPVERKVIVRCREVDGRWQVHEWEWPQ